MENWVNKGDKKEPFFYVKICLISGEQKIKYSEPVEYRVYLTLPDRQYMGEVEVLVDKEFHIMDVRCTTSRYALFFDLVTQYKVSPPGQYVCHSLEECSHACRNYITKHNLGGGNWTGGQILHPDKGQIAIVSYNGRIWKDNGKKKKVLFPGGEVRYMDAVDQREEITEGLNEELK